MPQPLKMFRQAIKGQLSLTEKAGLLIGEEFSTDL
jgi:hypothetical protein